MDQNRIHQKGQVLILVALGIVGLVGITALAIDGGNAFSERRRAQNAADTASMAAAREMVDDMFMETDGTIILAEDGDGHDFNWAAFTLANTNGYNDDGTTNTVTVNNPPGLNCKGDTNGPYLDSLGHDISDQYIQVMIDININTFFAQVVGIDQTHSCVEAVAYAEPPYSAILYDGSSVVALAPHECKAVKYNGTADAILVDGGIFVNSDCDCPPGAFFNSSSSNTLTAPSLNTVGCNNYNEDALDIGTVTDDADQVPYPDLGFTLPEPELDCNKDGPLGDGTPKDQDGGTIFPGNYYGEFPPKDAIEMVPGLYCVYAGNKGFNIRKADSLTGNNVTIALMTGGISWTGSDEGIYLTAPTAKYCEDSSGPYSIPCKYQGLLIFMPMENSSAVVLNGNTSWTIIGTILAPAAPITINGTEDGTEIFAQIIAYTVDITGDGTTNITYNGGDNWDGPYDPRLELNK